MSKKNEKDLRDVPEEVKSQMEFVFVEHINEVLKSTLDLDLKEIDFNDYLTKTPAPPAIV